MWTRLWGTSTADYFSAVKVEGLNIYAAGNTGALSTSNGLLVKYSAESPSATPYTEQFDISLALSANPRFNSPIPQRHA